MTAEEFFEIIRNNNDKAVLTSDGQIRFREWFRTYCPITFVNKKINNTYYRIGEALLAAYKLRLDKDFADEIMFVADISPKFYNNPLMSYIELRKQLLEACKLKEKF